MSVVVRIVTLLVLVLLTACGTPGSTDAPSAVDSGAGGAADTVEDVSGDATEDVSTDSAEDTPSDVHTDAVDEVLDDVGADAELDAEPDVIGDIAVDGADAGELDGATDVIEDARVDSGEPICEPGSTREEICADGVALTCTCMRDGSWTCDGTCRDGTCDDGSMLTCRRVEPTCEDDAIAAIIDSCWECVNPATCVPWGEPGCASDLDCDAGAVCDPCATGSCSGCEDCVAGCVDTGCPSSGPLLCDALRPGCGDGQVAVVRDGCWACVDVDTCGATDGTCEDRGGVCIPDALSCTPTRPATRAEGCSRDEQCCAPGAPPAGACDDGSDALCAIVPPTCEGGEILAVQGSCYRCVNPATCAPWGEAGCGSDMDCDAASWCNGCASGSCEGCRDCVPGCTLHGCDTESVLTCRCARPDCGEGNTSVIRDGCWVCVDALTCEDVRGGCE